MPKIDIRKHASAVAVHYEPLPQKLYATDIARLRGITPAGRELLAKAPGFCRLERAIIARILAGKPVNKAAILTEFGLPGRMFNAAQDSAVGLIRSAKACAELALEGTREAIARGLVQYSEAEADPGRQGELRGRRRRLARLVEQEARHERIVQRPGIFPGGDLFRAQHKSPKWKQAYLAKRSNHLSANGGADEEHGNKTLQVTLGPVEQIGDRLWQWFFLKHSRKPVATFRLWASECADLVQAVQANGPSVRKVPSLVWFGADGKKIYPVRQKQMEQAGERPASTRLIDRAVTAGRIGLTIDLRRQENGHWYIHVSREQKDLPQAYVPHAWLGIDLNCDSVASAVVSMRGGLPVLESFGKEHFPAGGPAGERTEVLHGIINRLVAEAKHRRLGIALEYLDFEHCKRWLRTKLGALLHLMPYRQIRGIFERRCREAGVPLRYVPPKYSSLLGALLSAKWPQLGRDQAAGAILALRASETGNPWLERACEQATKAERVSFRLNRKGQFGHTLVVEASAPPPTSNGNPGRQMDRPCFPVEPALQWQVACGRKISDAFSTLAALRAASLQERRRAAKAQKRSNGQIPRFKMPLLLKLDPPEPLRSSARSSLLKVA